MCHPYANIRLPGRHMYNRVDVTVVHFSFCCTCSVTPACYTWRSDGGSNDCSVARWWLLCGVQLLVVLEVLWLTALACVMGNVVDVERAKKSSEWRNWFGVLWRQTPCTRAAFSWMFRLQNKGGGNQVNDGTDRIGRLVRLICPFKIKLHVWW